MEKRWKVLSKSAVGSRQSVVNVLLENRGITDKEAFFDPPKPDYLITQLPSYLPDLDRDQLARAVERIQTAVRNKEKIAIWGDYDVDGITSTAILWSVLSGFGGLGADAVPYIPDRFSEGYGLNKKGIRKLSEEGVRLVVTVDSGITAKEAVEYANSLGLEVIITDHHLKPKELPPAYAVVHTVNLCGAGIAWLLASYLDPRPYTLDTSLDLVAIATVADLQPLLGANRSLAKYGFEVLNRSARPGLAALAEVAGLKLGNLGSYAAGWVLGPRINAVGRMGRVEKSGFSSDGAIEALRLLCTQDLSKARELAHLLNAANAERRALTADMFDHAKCLVNGGEGLIVVFHEDWHEGIIGLVAGKLVEACGRPAVVIARGEEFSKGSARSVNGFNILEALRSCSDLLEDVGGHEQAAGFTVSNKNLERFVEELRGSAAAGLKDIDPRPVLKIDMELPLQSLSYELVAELEKFEPCGLGNPEPAFVAHGVNVLEERKVGRQKQHLKLLVSPGFEAIWFGHGGDGGFTPGEEVSLVYTPQVERWNGKEKIALRIRDLRRT